MPEMELSVLRPPDQRKLIDDLERGDTFARSALTLVAITKAEINAGGVGCIICHRRINSGRGVTYCCTLTDVTHALRAAICASCTEAYSPRDLCLIASESLSEHLLAQHAAHHGGTFHEAGHA
jgi:hypothetical protein